MLIDTHAHLNFKDFEKDLDTVVKNSLKDGVKKIICASSNLEDSQKAIELAKKYPGAVYAMVGIHPQKTDPENSDSLEVQLDKLAQLAKSSEVVAIGECGLDFSPAPPGELDRPKEEQFLLFGRQIQLAQKLKLPICIHSRKTTDETIRILERYFLSPNPPFPLSPPGVWHCYTGGKSKIQKVIELGLFFGLDGNLTYDEGLQNVAKEIPLEKILLETDSPYLSPLPFRGLRNEPKNVKIIAKFLAKSKSIPVEKIAETTTQNAAWLFKLLN